MKKPNIMLVILFSCIQVLFAQNKIQLNGEVVNTTGEKLSGVTISLSNSNQKFMTDENGSFSFEYVPGTELTINSLGFATQQVTMTNQTTLRIVLIESEENLEQIVVVGYGTQRKGETTGSVASVKSESFNQGAVRMQVN